MAKQITCRRVCVETSAEDGERVLVGHRQAAVLAEWPAGGGSSST